MCVCSQFYSSNNNNQAHEKKKIQTMARKYQLVELFFSAVSASTIARKEKSKPKNFCMCKNQTQIVITFTTCVPRARSLA